MDDEDLDSGDDIDRSDRIQHETKEVEPETVTENYNVMDVDFPRHPIPEPSDGEVHSFEAHVFIHHAHHKDRTTSSKSLNS